MKQKLPRQAEQGLRDLASEEPEPFHYERTMARVHSAGSATRRTRIMKTLTSTAIGVGAVAVIFLALVFIPATYDVKLGSIVTVTLPSAEIPNEQVFGLVSAMQGVTSSTINNNNGVLTLDFAFNGVKKQEAEMRVREALSERFNPDELTFTSDDVTVQAGGNALAALTGGRITIYADGMTDEEIEAAIAEQLQAHLGSGGTYFVDVDSNEDGEMTIQVEAIAGPGEELPENFEFFIEGGGQVSGQPGQNVERRIVREVRDE